MKSCVNIVVILLLCGKDAQGFVPRMSRNKAAPQNAFLFMSSDDIDSEDMFAALKARQVELGYEKYIQAQKWRNAETDSQIKVRLEDDWVRRLDVSEYPFAACGSTSGNIYVVNLETGQVLAKSADAHTEEKDLSIDVCIQLERLRAFLHYGSGRIGTLAIAFSSDLICVSNPMDGSSGIHVYRFDGAENRLVSQGSMKALGNVIVTCMEFDEDYLWVGTIDGIVSAYPLSNDGEDSELGLPLTLQTQPEMQWIFSETILSISLSNEIGHGLVTTTSGSVELINLEGDDDGKPVCSLYPPLMAKENVLTAILAQTSSKDENAYAIVCGGGDGSIWIQPVNMDQYGDVSRDQPFQDPLQQVKPAHQGPVKCLANPIPGFLVSGAADGSLRVWDTEENASMYQFVGYKIWMGSIWTDGSRLVTDGSDNKLIVHDFLSEDNDCDL